MPDFSSERKTETRPSDSLDQQHSVLRPLHVLVPLIKEDLRLGDEAAKRAGLAYYRAAGEKMLEAKGQVAHGEFLAWVDRNFRIGKKQASIYMDLARSTSGDRKFPAGNFRSLSDFV